MKRLLFFLSVIILMPLQAIAAQPEITAESKITAVTVYPDRAMVTRKATVKLGKGDYRVVFPDLPGEALDDSIRISGQGTAKARIGSVDTKKVFLEATGKEDVKKLQDELQGLMDEDRRLADEQSLAAKQKEFYQAIQFHNAEVWSKEITQGKPTVDDWAKVVTFLQGGQRDAVTQAQGLDIKRRELKDKIEALKKRLAEMQSAGGKVRLAATVEVTSLTEGALDIELRYLVMGATWSPYYEARADVDSGVIELDYMGQVSQRSSEDWKDAELALSTARPAAGAAPPELMPWYVRIFEPVYYDKVTRGGMLMKQAAPAPMARAKDEAMGGMAEAENEPVPAEVMTAEAEVAGTSVVFKAPGRVDIPADGTSKKVTLSQEKLKAAFSYFTVPKLSPFAYLNGKIENTTTYPLLAGQAGVFMGGDYLGKSTVPLTAPGGTAELSLGIDEGIKVKRELVHRQEENTGIISKTRRISFAYRITLENFKKTKQNITVQDQLPVSQQAEVVVKEVKLDPQPTERGDNGLLKWKLDTASGEKREIWLEFYIEFPRDKNISGI
jgi:uncharacterized protein (TIGR02231 family)